MQDQRVRPSTQNNSLQASHKSVHPTPPPLPPPPSRSHRLRRRSEWNARAVDIDRAGCLVLLLLCTVSSVYKLWLCERQAGQPQRLARPALVHGRLRVLQSQSTATPRPASVRTRLHSLTAAGASVLAAPAAWHLTSHSLPYPADLALLCGAHALLALAIAAACTYPPSRRIYVEHRELIVSLASLHCAFMCRRISTNGR